MISLAVHLLNSLFGTHLKSETGNFKVSILPYRLLAKNFDKLKTK